MTTPSVDALIATMLANQKNMECKLDDHGHKLDTMQQAISMIVAQNVRLDAMQLAQTDLRVEVTALDARQRKVIAWQASCPRGSIKTLWGVIITLSTAAAASFFLHVFGAVKP